MSSGQGQALLALLGLDRTVAAGDGPAQFEGRATGAWGAPVRLKAKISGAGLEAEAEGSAEPWAPEPKASISLKVARADFGPLLDLAPTDTLAQNIALSSRVQLAGNRLHLRRSRQQPRRFAPARQPCGDARRGEGNRGRNRRRADCAGAGVCAGARRRRPRCRRAARHGAGEGLAWPYCIPGVARRASGRKRIAAGERGDQERRPVAGVRWRQGQGRRRRCQRQHGFQAGCHRHRVECEPRVLRGRRLSIALSQSRGAGRPRIDADDADEPGPQRLGAGGRAVRQRNAGAGGGQDSRPRSARLRSGGPRQ